MTSEDPTSQTTDTRGASTRADLIEAGIELFGTLGYHAAGSRALAEAAGVNQALIGYHFGGKRGLYLAVFEHIADGFTLRMGPTAAELLRRLEDPELGEQPEALIESVTLLVERAAVLFASPETAPWAMLIVREQQNPSEAFDLVWSRIMSRVTGLLCRILEALRGHPVEGSQEHTDIRLLALTLIGQPLVFRMARETALRTLGWTDIGQQELEAIQRRLRRNVRSLLIQEIAS